MGNWFRTVRKRERVVVLVLWPGGRDIVDGAMRLEAGVFELFHGHRIAWVGRRNRKETVPLMMPCHAQPECARLCDVEKPGT